MYQFFVEEGQIEYLSQDGSAAGATVRITGGDDNHIRNVLRMRAGERIRIAVRGKTEGFFAVIRAFEEGQVLAEIESEDEEGTELSNRICLFQGLPKGDKMELIVQKAVELGADAVVPVAMKRSVVKLDEKKAEKKTLRWQTIAESAAKQSKRSVIPQIFSPVAWSEALALVKEWDVALVCYENERGMDATREAVRRIGKGQSIAVIVGPEGGFDESEIASLDAAACRISLGKRILRTETAGIAALAMLVYELED